MQNKTSLDTWIEVYGSLVSRDTHFDVHPIHSCLIDGLRYFIHSPSLATDNPNHYQKLIAYAQKYGALLKEDQRSNLKAHKNCRRQKLLPIIFFAFSLSGQCVFSESSEHNETEKNTASHISLKFIGKTDSFNTKSNMTDMPSEQGYEILPKDLRLAITLKRILLAHFIPQGNDPITIIHEIENLAEYYSSHPDAAKIIISIRNKKWTLKYAPHTFQTEVQGTRLSVKDATIYFDPSSGAKLKFYDKCKYKKLFCVASPADALLHEFLHVHSILVDTHDFISQGGMVEHIYPEKHEQATILKENDLYKAMSKRDKRPRPIRNDHTGRHIFVSCVTCVE